ncbi:DNA polymerase III subunit delta' [Shewanella aestuarii]|uniref:DNA-directed DNA polymerase n=1 Tax=Shewanella aestuarii TaxID=1028752 RepID=A0A6G9QKY2_9GAMM|nr:DNA polymerase III subunit delta' [Shewanella aestuarii]QIR14725.1 DNA polymerase III subunit delta' [Shewanella aestuarii]
MTDYALTQLPWLQMPFERFAQLCYQNRHSHAQLLPVDEALGGYYLANEMAQMALCLNKTPFGACQQCKSCLLYKSGNHPDVHWVRKDGAQIKVDQIRELCQSLLHTAQQGGARIAVIENSERMNTAAANALLKTLEEPGDNTLLILQTDTPASLLPTITSRCQKIAFIAPQKSDIVKWLDEQHLLPRPDAQGKRHDVTWCLGVVGGPLKLADSLSSKHYQQLLDYRQDWAASLKNGHLQNSLLKLSEQQIIDALKVLYLYLRQYVLKSTKLDPLNQAKVIELAGSVMQMSHKLATMANVNTQALCQQYLLQFRHLLALS